VRGWDRGFGFVGVCVVGLYCFVLVLSFFLFFSFVSSFFVYVERPWSLILVFIIFIFDLM